MALVRNSAVEGLILLSERRLFTLDLGECAAVEGCCPCIWTESQHIHTQADDASDTICARVSTSAQDSPWAGYAPS